MPVPERMNRPFPNCLSACGLRRFNQRRINTQGGQKEDTRPGRTAMSDSRQ